MSAKVLLIISLIVSASCYSSRSPSSSRSGSKYHSALSPSDKESAGIITLVVIVIVFVVILIILLFVYFYFPYPDDAEDTVYTLQYNNRRNYSCGGYRKQVTTEIEF